MSYVDRIIEKFGSMAALARALGHQHVSTVQGWRERQTIPSRQQAEVLRVAREARIDLRPDDFFDLKTNEQAA